MSLLRLFPILVALIVNLSACSNEYNTPENFSKSAVDVSKYQDINSHLPIESLERFVIQGSDDQEVEMFVAEYLDDDEKRRAIVYPVPRQENNEKMNSGDMKKQHQYRHEKWQFLSAAVKKHAKDLDRFITYWDNAQRLHLLTGRTAIPEQPSEEAYADAEERVLWRKVGGGFSQEDQLRIFAQCLIGKAADAKSCLRPLYTDAGDNYILMSADDLAHIQEISRLTGEGLPLETRLFSTDSDLHGQIKQVREWAREGEGTGSYMLQPIDEHFVRAWRIIDPAFEDSLLASLLPFTTAAEKEFTDLKLVFQSDWGGYLSLYQVVN
jgi:hydroxylamine oxidation protein HaoB